MGIMAFITKYRAARKLQRGQCFHCQCVLRDDETSMYCSDECAAEDTISRAF